MLSQTEKRVIELRLKPIYDNIDNDQPALAIRNADRILKKYPQDAALKVLKAIAFLRMNKDGDALNILEELDVDGAKHNELTLQAFVQCYKEINLSRNICTLYERVIAWNPTEHNLTFLFFAYVRVQDYNKQLATVQRLWREFSKPDYFYWYMITLVMQARAFPDKAKLSYAVANKSIQSFVEKTGYKDLFGLELHLLVLEGLGNYNEAVKLLHSKKEILNGKPDAFVRQQELDLLVKAEEWEEVALCSTSAVIINGDDWKSWSTYMDMIITILQKPDLAEEEVDKFLTGFVKVMTDILNEKIVIQRGPYLAKLEMLYRLKTNNITNTRLSELLGNIGFNLFNYIKKFHKKPCCYVDIETYLPFVQDDEQWFDETNRYLSELYTNYKNQINSDQKEQDAVQSCELGGRVLILQEKIKARIGRSKYENRKEMFSMVAKLLDHEEELANLSFTLKESSALEQCSSELILMCVSSLWKDWSDKKDNNWLSITESALICEQALKVVKYDYTSKLALCRFYSHIGVIDRCRDLYANLDIKSVQQETLGHIIFHQYELCGRYVLGIKHYYESLSGFFTQADRELGETLVSAVKNKAVLQATGIIDLYDRMQKSTLQCANDVLSRYLSCLFSLKAVDETLSILEGDPEVIDWDGLCDNRELSLLPGSGSGDFATHHEREKIRSQREFVDITQLRHYICKALASVGLVHRCSAEKLRNNVVLLNNHIDHCRSSYPTQGACRQLQSASPCRLGDWIHQGHLGPVMRLMKSAVEIAFTHQEKAELTPELLPSVTELAESLNGILPVFDSSVGAFFVHEPLFKASRAFQSLATCKLLTDFIERRIISCVEIKKPKTSKTKQPKAEPLHPIHQRCRDLSKVVLEELYKLNEIFINAVSHINSNKTKLVPSLESDVYDGVVMTFMQDNYNNVVDLLNSSYTASLGSMTGLMAEHFNVIPRRNK